MFLMSFSFLFTYGVSYGLSFVVLLLVYLFSTPIKPLFFKNSDCADMMLSVEQTWLDKWLIQELMCNSTFPCIAIGLTLKSQNCMLQEGVYTWIFPLVVFLSWKIPSLEFCSTTKELISLCQKADAMHLSLLRDTEIFSLLIWIIIKMSRV